jgi:parallel beta-helix repeat protein
MNSLLGPVARPAMVAVAICMALLPGSAMASHVQCGDVITQDTTLDSDLVDCPFDGVRIGASNVTLDLNGHTVDGNGAGAGVSSIAYFPGHSGVTVRGGTIRDFEYGVALTASDGLVEDVVALENRDGGILVSGSRHQITRSMAIGNGSGIWLAGGSDIEVSRNFAANNAIGIDVHEAHGNRVIRNTLSDNGNQGLQAGIRVYGSWGNAVEQNRVAGGRIGILVQSPIDEDSPPANDFVRNRVTRAAEDGIQIDSTGGMTRLLENLVTRSGDDGIVVGSIPTAITDRSAVLARNIAHHNGDLGIEAVPGVIDGGQNHAFLNGNPLQCLVVACRIR